MLKCIVGKGNEKHLVVDKDVHTLVKVYARENGISVNEATWRLINIAFAYVWRLPMPKFISRPSKAESAGAGEHSSKKAISVFGKTRIK